MRVTLHLFGAEVIDFSIGPDEATEPEYVDCGTTGSTVVGFSLPTTPQDFEPRQYEAYGDEDA